MGLASKMRVSTLIEDHFSEIETHLGAKYSFMDIKKSIDKFLHDGRLKIKKTNECPALIPFFWYKGEFSINKKIINSSGEGHRQEVAQMRCIGELFERIPIFHDDMNCLRIDSSKKVENHTHKMTASNGVSFSLDPFLGIFNSYREIIERQVVLDFWLRKKECQEITGLYKWGALNFLSGFKNNLKAHFYCLPNDYGLFVICCHLSQDKVPYNIFGYGCHENIYSSLEKAFFEAWRFYWEFHKLKGKSYNKYKGVTKFIDHFYFYAFKEDIENVYFPTQKRRFSQIKGSLHKTNDFHIDEIYIFDLKKFGIPGYSVQVIKNNLWPFKPGALKEDTMERECGEVHPVA